MKNSLSEQSWRKRVTGSLPGLLLPFLLFLWWFLATTGEAGQRSLFPAPYEVMRIFLQPGGDLLSTGSLYWNTSVSLLRITMGFFVAVLIAIPLGFFMGSSRNARKYLSFAVEMARPLSPIALVPLSLILFRSRSFVELFNLSHLRYQNHILHEMQIGMVFILFWGAFFPVLLGTIQGVRGVRKIHLEAGRLLGAGRIFLFKHIVLPSALPDIFTGLRLGIGRSWMVIIAAEMLPGTNAGLGYLIRYSYEVLRIDVMVACLVIVAIFGAFFSKGLAALGEKSLVLRSRER